MKTNYLIDENKINEIRSNIDIVDVISEYLPLTGKGKNFFGVCPFHDDHSPSMSVNKDLQIYKCFSCGAGGNVFKFVSDYENISFVESVKLLADKAGIPLDININDKKIVKNKEYYDMYSLASKFYINNINTQLGSNAKEYLNNRGIDNEIIKTFGIGLSIDTNSLIKLLEKKGYNDDLIENYGLASKHGINYLDMFYNRITFPLHDFKGDVIGFSGRIYHGEDTNKYLNTKQTVGFNKSNVLYNYHRAKDIARKNNQIIVVEGYMDVIGLYKIGILNVVATMGTSVTKEQIGNIKKMAKEIILLFDGDAAGEKATDASIEMLHKSGIEPKVVRLEDNLDPEEYIKKYGKDKFLSKLTHPINTMEFKLKHLKNNKDFTNNVDVSKYANEVIDELNKIEDNILREITLKKLSEEINLDVDILRDKLNSTEKKRIEQVPVIIDNKKHSKYEKAEQYLLYYMMNNKEVVKKYKMRVTYIPTERYRLLAREIDYYYTEHHDIKIADLISVLQDDKIMSDTILEIINLNIKENYSLEEIDDYIDTIASYNINNEIIRLQKLIKNETDVKEKAILANRIVELKKQREVEGENI